MDPGYQSLRQELKELRGELNARLEALSASLVDLARLEGSQHRHEDALHRVGRQVDNHEERLRAMEGQLSGDVIRWQLSRWIVVFLVTGTSSLFTGAAVGITVFYFTQGGGA